MVSANDGGIDSDYDGNAGWNIYTCHNGCYSKKYLGQISILGTNMYQIWKMNCTFVSSTLKVVYLVPLFFNIYYLFLPEIKIFPKYFFDAASDLYSIPSTYAMIVFPKNIA